MTTNNSDLRQFITDLPLKQERASKLYWLYTVIAVGLSVAWLSYSFYHVRRLRAEVTQQQTYLEQTKSELKSKNEELEMVAQQLRIPLEELHNLRNFGYLSGSERVSDLQAFVDQSRMAKAELQKIPSTNPEKARRAHLYIRYYLRAIDNGRVKEAMDTLAGDYGFKVNSNDPQKEPNTYSNAIWIIDNRMTVEDVKLAAYYLILRGIQIKYIGPPTSTPERIRPSQESIWILAEPKAKDEPVLTVQKITSLTQDDLKRGTKTLSW